MATKTGKKNARGGIEKVGLNTKDASGNFVLPSTQKKVASFTNTSGQQITRFEDTRTQASSKTATKSGGSDGGIGVISSNQGKDTMKKADETINRLAPEPITADPSVPGAPASTATAPAPAPTPTTAAPAPTAPAPEASKDFVTYVNEATGQEQTLRGAAITDLNKKSLEQQGYKVATADTATVSTPKDPEMERLDASIAQYDQQIGDFMKGLEDTLITDKELRSEIRGLKNTYRQRADDERQINEQRVQALTTLGIRTGSRYTGGAGGVIGSIITEEERQGLRRITALDTELESKINEAKRSAQDQNYKVYAQQVQYAEKLKEQKVAEVAALKKVAAEENKKKVELARSSLIDSVISSFIDQGVTNRGELFAKLTDPAIAGVIGGVTAEEFKKTFDALMPTGTGIIGEYEYYKREAQRMGQTPLSFDDYQTRDANRKRSVTNVMMGDYTSQQIKAITSLNDKISTNDTYKKTSSMKTFANNVKIALSQKTGTGDIAAINQFQKVVDEGAVTRDQDVQLIKGAQSLIDRLKTQVAGWKEGDQLSDPLRLEMDTIVQQMMATQVQSLQTDPFIKAKTKEAELNGIDIKDTILSEITAIGTGDSILQDEAKVETAIVQWVASSPENVQRLKEMQALAPDASLSEIAQELGISL